MKGEDCSETYYDTLMQASPKKKQKKKHAHFVFNFSSFPFDLCNLFGESTDFSGIKW